MNILIAGGGVGGLTAALCLAKSGHQVRVFERASALSEVGAGLQCGANAIRVLDYLGLRQDVERTAVVPQRVDFRDGVSGDVLYSMQLGGRYLNDYGAPYLHVHRADLHHALHTAVLSSDQVELILGATVQRFNESADRVELELTDDRVFTGDCLIGADGVNSLIRKQLHGDLDAAYTGNVAWRAVVPTSRLPEDFMDVIASNFMGQRKHAVIYYLQNKNSVNFVGVVEDSQWRDESWSAKAPWAELKSAFAGWHPTVQAVIDAINKDDCYRWALRNHLPFSNWSTSRVTLLGDAAHATLPFMASGAAMALEDARILQRALDQADSIAEGLQLYQRNRAPRTGKVQTDSARFGKLYHIQNRLALKLAFQALRRIGARKERFLPEYDANTVELI